MNYSSWEICTRVFVGVLVILAAPISLGYTDPGDVSAINSLFVSLGSPALPGWIPNGGDPCLEAWQGVTCDNSNITSIIINGANLGGELGNNLGSFTSIISIDFSNNQIGGSIPSNLPLTMKNLFLSANQFSGSIPSSLSLLTQLAAMSLNDNLLNGEIPDAFQALTGLVNLDLSSNNLSGQLPSTVENLSSLTTLRLQNNQLSGTLDVLQDLPLRDLNVENNLFSGPIPEKLLSIPTFKKDGNPFNTSSAPLSPPGPPDAPAPPLPTPPLVPPRSRVPASESPPGKLANGPSTQEGPSPPSTKKSFTTKRIVGIAVAGVLIVIIIVFGLVLFMLRCCERRHGGAYGIAKRHERGASNVSLEKPRDSEFLGRPSHQIEKVPKESVVKPKDEHGIADGRMGAIAITSDKQETEMKRMGVISKQKEENQIDRSLSAMSGIDMIIVNPILPSEVTSRRSPPKNLIPPTFVRSFTVASLQQYTNSFSQENLIGGGMLGSVYRAELPDGKMLAVKKLDNARLNDEVFLELVSSISRLQHVNVVELVGYCLEHGQRLLIYEYCSNGTLHDALHSYDESNRTISWNARIRMALGAARALEYLHEVCQPPIVHRNFKSANVLLDDELAVRVSDCGLAPLIASGSVSQLSGQLLSAYGYGAPEFETGSYTHQSDVYSFGVVMLELLTGRKSYDRSRPRGEQFLVRWAIPQLHDIEALSKMVDPSLNGVYPAKSLSRFADIISLCVQSEPEFRPPMSEIVQNLMDMIQREPLKSSGELSEKEASKCKLHHVASVNMVDVHMPKYSWEEGFKVPHYRAFWSHRFDSSG
ncbi:Protein kinase domain [Macleaya cordata]|uniref:Protein kinase domain n=1 Tax=Macleaya cordata TaxID=56857 RepID=A0A200QTZ5_MACCD|nr:Protein kinase domain [Macleaya cordata]